MIPPPEPAPGDGLSDLPSCCPVPPAPAVGALLDPDHRTRIDRRLARLEGQVRGVRRMVEEGRWCLDVLTQVEAVQEGLRAVSAELLSGHLRHCVVDAARSGTPESLAARLDEVDTLLRRRRS